MSATKVARVTTISFAVLWIMILGLNIMSPL